MERLNFAYEINTYNWCHKGERPMNTEHAHKWSRVETETFLKLRLSHFKK